MMDWYRVLVNIVYIACLSICVFILSSRFFSVSLLRIARAVAWIRFLTSKDLSFIRRHLLSNCQHIYKKRIQGKTRCNYLRYYGCKIRDSLLCVPHYRHTLILDLDETLIYSCRYSDLSLMVPSLESVGVTILRDNRYVSFYVYKRPYLDRFLDAVCEWYDVIVFTAGEKPYADAVLNVIDPKGRVKKRLYKDDCILVNGSVVKRVETACRNLSSAIIIDNNPECYRFDKANAIAISSWYGNSKDKELQRLLPFLDLLRTVEDVRHVLSLDAF
ncbi:hypothetical protein WA538_001595 [Blastocystis sp. DL]